MAPTDVVTRVEDSVRSQRVVNIQYRSLEGVLTARTVLPLKVWSGAESKYMEAFCLYRKEIRTFRLDRVECLVDGGQ